ncbi:amidase [Aureimonas sp. AU20]|uniref:amidase n=1 Tax=Aureimonas sp. AU20 TaxID=1349819 RepID=UPI00071F57A4|nr:amidase [Aureimonas sp. AU20]ALN74753.1 hypothetical protein M673_18695 [Aureimonas sp. AU20]
MTDLLSLDAAAVLTAFADRRLSPVEYFDAVTRRIELWEPHISALYAYDPEGACAAAKASEARWAKGAPTGPLDGLPVTVKELIATEGTPIPLGTAATTLLPAAVDAPSAARLREAGAILFAKTTCPDFGMLSSGLSTFHKLTRNPWNLARNPGGSSAGAGAAAAAGYGPLHLGTDIGGSVRLPANWCGLFGLKPSNGRIPIDPYYVGRSAGPMTRSVADAALMMPVLSLPDARDAISLPYEALAWGDFAVDVSGLRIGLMLDAGCGLPVDDSVRAVAEAAARRFEAVGARIVEVPGVLTRTMLDGLDDFWRAKFWGDMALLDEAARGRVLPAITEWAERGGRLSGVEVARGFNRTLDMARACAALFQEVDVVLSPTAPVVHYPAEWPSPTNDPAGRPFEHIAFTVPWNMSGQPAASINAGFTPDGFPIGMQIVGPRFGDLLVMRLSKLFESWRAPIRWPEPPRAVAAAPQDAFLPA